MYNTTTYYIQRKNTLRATPKHYVQCNNILRTMQQHITYNPTTYNTTT